MLSVYWTIHIYGSRKTKKPWALLFEETLERIEANEKFYTVSLDSDILNIVDKIKVDMEMHDKLIVATALYYEAALITKDELVSKSGVVSTIW